MSKSQIITRFGASVRNLRHRMGISQETLAERADLHRTYIAGIEGGVRNVTLRSIEKLASALQVPIETLLLQTGGGSGWAEPSSGSPGGGKYVDILMVEDNSDDTELALRAFKEARINNPIQVVTDGEAALDYLFCKGRFAGRKLEHQPQLVLLDLQLPKMSGLDVLRRLRADQQTRQIPVVILTVSREAGDISECRRLGVQSYITKPVNFLKLSQATAQLNLDWALLKPPILQPNGS